MDSLSLLNKWRHLIEPETSTGLTPTPWDDVCAKACEVHELGGSVIVTIDGDLNGKPVRTIWVAAGDLGEVLQIVKRVEDSAREAGKSAVVFMGRRGWVRSAVGYKDLATIGMKEL